MAIFGQTTAKTGTMRHAPVCNIKSYLVLAVAVVCAGCKFLMPAHPNSNFRAGEKVNVELLTAESIKNDPNVLSNYMSAFKKQPGERDKVVFLPILASAAVGLGVDFVNKELGQEAQQYQAQFSTAQTFNDFWSQVGTNEEGDVGGQKQKYYGARVTRQIKSGTNSPIAFDFICGWQYDAKCGLWTAKPLRFQTLKTKAKVLSDKWYHQLLVFPWLLRYPSSEINSEIEIDMVGHIRDVDQMKKDIPMGTLNFKIESYDISKCEVLETIKSNLNTAIQGPFVDAPLPVDRHGKPIEGYDLGTFTVTARVTESDASNVTNAIEKASALLSANKATLQKAVPTNSASGGKGK